MYRTIALRLIVVICFFFVLPFKPVTAQELTVAVASNVQFPFEELKDLFKNQTGISVRSVVGASGQLYSQIQNGAPFDVFLSADMDYPQKLYDHGLVINTPEIYAFGTLVLWTLSHESMVCLKSIEGLLDSQVKKIAIASPDAAPYGRQAMSVLKYYGLFSRVKEKIVYGQSLSQVNQFVRSGSAQVGFTSMSTLVALPLNNRGQWMEIDRRAYEPMAQGVVILKHASKENLENAHLFYEFMFSSTARIILEKYGYQLPEKDLNNE